MHQTKRLNSSNSNYSLEVVIFHNKIIQTSDYRTLNNNIFHQTFKGTQMSSNQQRVNAKTTSYIGQVDHAPEHLKVSFITHGYRINHNCSKMLLKSAFTIHNQTINVWTHLLPSLIIVFTLAYISFASIFALQEFFPLISKINDQTNRQQDVLNTKNLQKIQQICIKNQTFQQFATLNLFDCQKILRVQNLGLKENNNHSYEQQFQTEEKVSVDKIELAVWPIYQFMACSAFCMLCSSIFHLFNPLSLNHFIKLARLDLSGIFLLIASSSEAVLYYGLYQNSNFVAVYSAINLIFGVTLFFVSLGDTFYKKCNLKYKIASCLGYAFLGVIPFFHIMILGGTINRLQGDCFNSNIVYNGILSVLGSYGIGVIIYTKRLPESIFPGKFNIIGHSHQIWHLFVVAGAVLTYDLIISSYQMRKMAILQQGL